MVINSDNMVIIWWYAPCIEYLPTKLGYWWGKCNSIFQHHVSHMGISEKWQEHWETCCAGRMYGILLGWVWRKAACSIDGDTFPISSRFSLRNYHLDVGKTWPEVKHSSTTAIRVQPDSSNSHAHIWESSPFIIASELDLMNKSQYSNTSSQ